MCQYCNSDFAYLATNYDMEIRLENGSLAAYCKDHRDYNAIYFNINYCPMCGRKLKEDSDD